MKKRVVCSFMLAAAMTSLCVLTACGEGDDPEIPEDPVTWDQDAPAYGSDADVTISVKAKKYEDYEGRISDTLFGVFLEDINYAGYYLDSDLILNGNFDANTKAGTYGWSALNGNTVQTLMNDGNGIFANTAAYKTKNVNPQYMKISVNNSGAGGIRNTGYDGTVPLAMEEGTDYVFSAFVRSPEKSFDMGVKVQSSKEVCLEGSFQVDKSSEWVKYTRTFTATASADFGLNFDLVIPAGTEVFVDGVSLKTTDSTLGFKNTPYNAIKDLAPKFIRFPGGCIIEGDSRSGQDCAYDWKNSIGAVQTGNKAGDDTVPAFTYKANTDGTVKEVTTYGEEVTRKANPNLWSFNQTSYYDLNYGIGFYDFFMLCDSIGASAVPVVNAGISCMGGVPEGQYSALNGRHNLKVADYIQDAIDLIEFAKGDKTTKWGAIRAAMGHEEPFEMNYIGIGNEQWGEYYTGYYEKFLESDAFLNALEQYDVKPIVGNGVAFGDCEMITSDGVRVQQGMARSRAVQYLAQTKNENLKIGSLSEYGVVDQHYYVDYMTLLQNTEMYDDYARPYTNAEEYYEVFVGEYSANGATSYAGEGYTKYKKNEWITALSEAAMMTGYERNGDIIRLAAYAPMFGTAADFQTGQAGNQWGTDMMYFSNTKLVLSANYYVQQLFMKNQGAYRVLEGDHGIEWRDGVSPTFSLAADDGSSKTQTVNKLFYVASLAGNGDVIVKIVNVSGETLKADIALSDVTLKGNADVTVLQCDDRTAKNTLEDENVYPDSYKIGAFSGATLGYEVKPYSVTSVTVHVK